MSANGRRGLFRDIEPFSFGWLSTDGPHEIYYEECGAPRGKPAVILHGGPGGAVNPTMRRFFDPSHGAWPCSTSAAAAARAPTPASRTTPPGA
jgi:hypothetical protein